MNKKGITITDTLLALILVVVVVLAVMSFGPKIWDLIKAGVGLGDTDIGTKKAITDKEEKLLPPRNLIATPQYSKKIIVSWLKSNSPNVKSYSVVREEIGKSLVNVCDLPAGNSESYTCTDDKGLEIGKKYIYTVIAYDVNGEYSESSIEAVPNR